MASLTPNQLRGSALNKHILTWTRAEKTILKLGQNRQNIALLLPRPRLWAPTFMSNKIRWNSCDQWQPEWEASCNSLAISLPLFLFSTCLFGFAFCFLTAQAAGRMLYSGDLTNRLHTHIINEVCIIAGPLNPPPKKSLINSFPSSSFDIHIYTKQNKKLCAIKLFWITHINTTDTHAPLSLFHFNK